MGASAKPKSEKVTLSIYKNGQLIFSKPAVQNLGLEGALVKFLYDSSNRVIGFRKMNGTPIEGLSSDMRILKSKGKQMRTSLGKLLSIHGIEKATKKSLDIKEHVSPMDGKVYYVELK